MQTLQPSVGSNTECNNLVKLNSGNILSSGFKMIFEGKISEELIFCYNFGELILDAMVDFPELELNEQQLDG
jgi:hypothetical protein